MRKHDRTFRHRTLGRTNRNEGWDGRVFRGISCFDLNYVRAIGGTLWHLNNNAMWIVTRRGPIITKATKCRVGCGPVCRNIWCGMVEKNATNSMTEVAMDLHFLLFCWIFAWRAQQLRVLSMERLRPG